MTLPDIPSSLLELRAHDDIILVGFTTHSLTEFQNLEEMGQHMFSLVETFGYRKVIVNLDGVSSVSSAFLGKLITLHRKSHRHQGKLVVCGYAGCVADALHSSKLDTYLHTVRDLASALQAFG